MRRDLKISRKLLKKHGYSAGCFGCESSAEQNRSAAAFGCTLEEEEGADAEAGPALVADDAAAAAV